MINGELLELDSAAISATDLTLRRGYGLFDFFRVHDGSPLYFELHIKRLLKGIESLRLDFPYSETEITDQVRLLIGENQMEGITGIRIVVTGGLSADGFTPARSNVIITQERFRLPPESIYEKGTSLMTHEYRRELPEVKSLNYMVAVFLAPEMHARGTTEVLYHSDNHVSECTRSNIFCIRNGCLHTPVSDALEGITRGRVIEIARGTMDVEVHDFSLPFIMDADEVFITSTIKRIIPVIRIDEKQIADGNPGAYTRKLMNMLMENDNDYLNNSKRANE